MRKNCIRCGIEYQKKPCICRKQWEKSKFCSSKCSGIFTSEIGHQKLRGKKRPQEVVDKCLKTTFKKGIIPWNKGIPFLQLRGENHHNWKGGKTDENRRIRTSLEYKLWRRAVFERDDFICQDCKERGGTLHADHIKPFSLFPELRFAIDNGRTLCKECHMKTPTWGYRSLYPSKVQQF